MEIITIQEQNVSFCSLLVGENLAMEDQEILRKEFEEVECIRFIGLRPNNMVSNLAHLGFLMGKRVEFIHRQPAKSQAFTEEDSNITLLRKQGVYFVEDGHYLIEKVVEDSFGRDGKEFILLYADVESLFAFFKGVGVTYEEMESDAIALRGRVRSAKVSPLGLLIERAIDFYLTEPAQSKKGFTLKFATVIEDIQDWIHGDEEEQKEIELKYATAMKHGYKFIDNAEMFREKSPLPNIACYDFTACKNMVPLTPLNNKIRVLEPVRVYRFTRKTVVEYKDYGRIWKDQLPDLREIAPEISKTGGKRGLLPYRVEVETNDLHDFLYTLHEAMKETVCV